MTYKQPVRVLVGLLILSLVGCVEKPSGSDTNNDTTPIDMVADMTAPEDMDEDKPEDMAADMLVEDMPGDMPVVDMPVDMPVDMGPCGGTCEGETPVCDEGNGICVVCLEDTHCDSATPVCDSSTNTCVGCTGDMHCEGDTPSCDETSKTCVQCVDDDTCDGDAPRCDMSANACVGCLENLDCQEPDASFCDANQECGSCTTDDDCSHLGLNRCVGGVCNECTVATEADDCGNNACRPDGTCGIYGRESVDPCQPCEADNECLPDHRCIPMNFGNPATFHGNYCLKQASAACSKPYRVGIERESVSGALGEEYCGLNEVNTTCEAITDLRAGKACAGDSECGDPTLDDALCKTILGTDTCTISCGADNQCTAGQTCDMTENFCE